ncbi:MAG: helix-turn-helix domain-containing protein [Oligoflexales bacterium]
MTEKRSAGRPVEAPAPWGPLFEKVGGHHKLAKKLGVGKSTIGRWASGKSRIPELGRKELKRLCKYYEINEGSEIFQ